MLLITGATGNIGGELVRILPSKGHPTRALVRDPQRAKRLPADVERAVGDLDRPDTVHAALRGVDAVFHMQSSHGTTQTETMIEAARHSGVRRIVALSSMGAALDPMPVMGTWFAAREKLWRDSGLDVTYLRPTTLMPNALWWAPAIRAGHAVTDSTGPGRLSSIDTDDVAAVAAQALTEDGHVGQAYTLTGPELLTAADQVAVLAEVLGRDITYHDQTPGEQAEAAVANGTPAEAAEAMRDLYAMFRADGIAFLSDDVRKVTGRAPHTFADWARRNAARFGCPS